MSQPEELIFSQETFSEFILIQLKQVNDKTSIQSAIGTYKNEEDAYAAALIHQMQSIETSSDKWSKTTVSEKQEQIIELCRYIKQDISSYKERFEYMSKQCVNIFNDIYDIQYQVITLNKDTITPVTLNDSVFKTKIRNFLDVFQTKSDVEEDLGNSDDEEEDDEEEEEDEEDEEDLEEELGEEEEDIEEEEEEEEEDDEEEEDEIPTSEPIMTELDESSEEEGEEEEQPDLKRSFSALEEEEEEEDEIDEDGEDELDDDDDTTIPKRRRTILSDQ